ncbi:DUF1501 domain-containing protein [Planctomicrobium sp. SH661]|uniref:DUF1501 domain-containing protein n=1 Tax=Planctomicrobium sp. SH661 TaxID=3448124 RepID=UPI003F5CA2FF
MSQRKSSGCDGFRRLLNRRQAIQVGSCGALGLSLGDLLKGQANAESRGKIQPKAQSVIQIFLPGGFAQQESFDPKPEAPVDYRGPFGVAKTSTGEVVSDRMPMIAKVADKFTIVRSTVGKIPDHNQATYHLFTGYSPTTVIDYPQMGAVVSHQLGSRNGIPPYVTVPVTPSGSGGTGFLSSKYGAFQVYSDPGGYAPFKVRDFSIPEGVSTESFERRRALRDVVQGHIRKMEADPDVLNTMDEFYRSAYSLLTSTSAQQAFSLTGESQEMLDLYGTKNLKVGTPAIAGIGQRLILARRLVEAGVRLVTVTYGDWDCHAELQKTTLGQTPALDHALAGLITDLDQRGLLDSTLVMVVSEFGRTPLVNAAGGRDHWARVYSTLLAGGGITRGQMYGASDATCSEPARDAATIEDVLSTVYHQLGIDSNEELLAFGTRPIEIINSGRVIKEIVT